ncbi:phospholipid carrier-dependent glycosyltransferase [Lentisphaerota bacterium ZTH]|nr:phospholipid carrier-dependent glycosyltransferase [Lentisphaerota bacterium]WET07274.1 phospholipid carrier-dependent glycosyltransferase [Lentisphaerota bacterium ZTH]
MKKYYIGLIVLYVLIYIVPLGGRPLITPDEYRYGEIPREMLVTGNWVTPKLLGIRYFEKPVMGYWLNAISMSVFGENAFAIRLSAALSTGLTALLLFWLVLVSRKDPEEAVLGTGLFLTMGFVYGVGTFAVLDAPTSLFLTGTIVFFFLAVQRIKFDWQKILFLALAGASAGAAFLTKGFLAFAVPGLTIVAYLIWSKRWKDIFILPWIPLLFTCIVALPWSLAINRQEPNFWYYFFFIEHVQRFFKDVDTQHPEAFWFYLPILIGGAMPALLLLPAAFKSWKKYFPKIISDDYIKYAICWLVLPLVFFSASRGKLPTYIIPLFVPLAILLARGLIIYFREKQYKIFDWTAKGFAWALILAAAGFAIVQIIADCGVFKGMYSPAERWKWLAGGGAAIVWIFCLLRASRTKNYHSKASLWICAPLLAFFLSNYIIPYRYLESKAQGLYLTQFKSMVKPGMLLVAHPNVMHAAAFIFKNDRILLYTHGGELENGLKYPDARNRVISREEFHKLLKKTPKGKIIFIMRGDFREGVPKADFEAYGDEIMFSRY